MIVRICAFTDRGQSTKDKIIELFSDKHIFESRKKNEELHSWVEEAFSLHAPLIFIGACGIAVRAIAPFVEDKLADSPVLVVDEAARFVIPILSGHMGGANEWAIVLAEALNAQPCITTATDINQKWSADIFAKKNKLRIVNREGIAKVSSKLLRGECIRMAVAEDIEMINRQPDYIKIVPLSELKKGIEVDIVVGWDENYIEQTELLLIPRDLYVGMGCKKGTDVYKLRDFFEIGIKKVILDEKMDNPIELVAGFASIDLKRKEYGLVGLAQSYCRPFMTYSSMELNALVGDFHKSDFVRSVTGVDNVCERAAIACAGEGAVLVLNKLSMDGMTLAVARSKVRLNF